MSKDLINRGISPDTADLVWEWEGEGLDAIYLKYHYNKRVGRKRLPAWSIGALLALIPSEITINGEVYTHSLRKWHDPEEDIDKYEFSYMDYYNYSPKGSVHDEPDMMLAAYRLVCWLAENNLLKKSPSTGI